jgi:site-specific recombinase XerD
MNLTRRLHGRSAVWHFDSELAPYVGAFLDYLSERGYAPNTIDTYLSCVAHFAYWMGRCRLAVHRLDTGTVWRFLDEHLPSCDCPSPVCRTRPDLRAALGHLFVVLRSKGIVSEPVPEATPVDEELCRFDDYMGHVRGLADSTRALYLRTVRRLLEEQFGKRRVAFCAITPEAVRRFVANENERYSTPGSFGSVVSALRGYFRFRIACGDPVHQLIGAVPYPANWQLASLPKALSRAEVERLLASLDQAARRTGAMVRCALELGLRSGEIAKLTLDDIDWGAGTITLRRTKSRREDVLPLPETTGRAIVEYLERERPQTAHRAVFVRHHAPYDQPIGPDGVRKVIRRSYARAGLPYTRAHLLRHTLASRLLEGGSSLKEVADVLRHRSLNTTLIYAKLDSRSLASVALPWPGCAT